MLCRSGSAIRGQNRITNGGQRLTSNIASILKRVQDGSLPLFEAENLLSRPSDEALNSFANLDHSRTKRTGFPEAVFGAGKTPDQIAMILDDMARHFNEKVSQEESTIEDCEKAILATR